MLRLIIGVIVGAVLVTAVVSLLYFSLRAYACLIRGRRCLRRGDVSGAIGAFQESAIRFFTIRVGIGKEPFCRAVDGLADAYTLAGVDVDLDPLRKLHEDFVTLEKDKVFAASAEGLAIQAGIERTLGQIIQSLPVNPCFANS